MNNFVLQIKKRKYEDKYKRTFFTLFYCNLRIVNKNTSLLNKKKLL